MSSIAFTSRVKNLCNVLLRPVGLEIQTTLTRRLESARIQKLRDRAHWAGPRYTQGLNLNGKSSLDFLQNICTPYQADFRAFPQHANGELNEGFYLDNPWFGPVDAEVLYGFMRHFQPERIVEVGSGFSTRLMRRAIRDGNLRTNITSIDPNPRTSVQPYADTYIRSPVEDLAVSQIVDTMKSGDFLFIDSSHMVMTGGDIPYLFLEVLPKLKQGVYIHVHDIFLPFDYSEEWVTQGTWSEQYLVHAFLSYNPVFEILWPARFMWEYHKSRVLEVIPSNPALSRPPSSLWLKKII